MSSDHGQPDLFNQPNTSTTGGRKMTAKKKSTSLPRVVRKPNPTPEQEAELERQRKARGLSFTVPQARAAMDEKGRAWGYRDGYYRVTGKVGRRYTLVLPDGQSVPAHDYRVEVRLFSGRITTAYQVRFILDRKTHCFHSVLGVITD